VGLAIRSKKEAQILVRNIADWTLSQTLDLNSGCVNAVVFHPPLPLFTHSHKTPSQFPRFNYLPAGHQKILAFMTWLTEASEKSSQIILGSSDRSHFILRCRCHNPQHR
jgi:hypothetical protein